MPLTDKFLKAGLNAAKAATGSTLPAAGSTVFRRNYLPAPLFDKAIEISPKLGLFTQLAKFQRGGEGEAGNCDVHHAALAGEVLKKLQESGKNEGGILSGLVNYLMGSKPEEAIPTTAKPDQTPQPSTVIPSVPDEHIEKESQISVANICNAVRDKGFVLFKHYDEPIAAGGAYDAHHVVIVAGVFDMAPAEGEKAVPHAILIDCDPNRINLATESAREKLPEGAELPDLSSEELDEMGAKLSFTRVVNLPRMVTRTQGNWNSFKGRLDSGGENFSGQVDDYKPTITSVSREYLEKVLPAAALRDLLDPSKSIQFMGGVMQGNEKLIDYSTTNWRANTLSDVDADKLKQSGKQTSKETGPTKKRR